MHALMRGNLRGRIRLIAGLILFVFVLFHFLNHALGLVSLEAMHAFQEWRLALTRSTLGGIILYAALLAHVVNAFWRLGSRTTFRMPLWEGVQIGTGLLIPFYLIPHIWFTRGAHMMFDVNDVYAYELLMLWPQNGWAFAITLTMVWVHGCLGLHYWLRMGRWYLRNQTWFLVPATAVPVLALAGFVVAGRDMLFLIGDPDVLQDVMDVSNWPSPANLASIISWSNVSKVAFYCVVLGVGLFYLLRFLKDRAQERFDITYVDGPTLRTPAGPTLLEISRVNNIPHASVCGGRARCSTCRVRVHAGGEQLTPPQEAEQRTLQSVKAPPDVRLACQIRPTAPMSVTRIVRPMQQEIAGNDADGRGVEREMVVMFLDVRGFTRISDAKLPYDVVYILNQFFDGAGQAIREEGGWIDKYLGDGLMAVFGRLSGAQTGAAQALRAAQRIDLALDALNDRLGDEIGEPMKIGIGIHVGPVVMGNIGFSDTASMTVIGRTVNAASRLEALSKEMSSQLVISAEVGALGGLKDDLPIHKVQVRGLAGRLDVHSIESARSMILN